jgi:hypothetical protein
MLRLVLPGPGVGEQALCGGFHFGGGVVGERFAVSEARDRGVEGSQPTKRRGRLGAADVEHAAHDVAVRAPRCGVAGEQHPVPGQVERDAAWGVAGSGHCDGTAPEAELVAVGELSIDPRRPYLSGRELTNDLVVDGPFPVGQVRRGPGGRRPDERRVGVVCEHFHVAPVSDVGGGTDVIGVEMRQNHPPQVRGPVSATADSFGDRWRGTGKAGVDEREAIGV